MREGVDSRVLAYALADQRHAQCLSSKIASADDIDRALLVKHLAAPPGLEAVPSTPPTPDTIPEVSDSADTFVIAEADSEETAEADSEFGNYQVTYHTFDEIEAAMLWAIDMEQVASI